MCSGVVAVGEVSYHAAGSMPSKGVSDSASPIHGTARCSTARAGSVARLDCKNLSVFYTTPTYDQHYAAHVCCGLLRRGTRARKRTPRRCSALSAALASFAPPTAHLENVGETSALRSHRALAAPDPLARVPRGPREPRESRPGPITRAREIKVGRRQVPPWVDSRKITSPTPQAATCTVGTGH